MSAGQVITVWLFNDGKPGHYNQSLGLAQSLALLRPTDLHEFPSLSTGVALLALITGQLSKLAVRPLPDLIIGAGHKTHLSLLAARRCFGGRVVVLMQPSLPKQWFDLCLIPQHDAPKAVDNVIITRGVLNKVRAACAKKPASGLILVGGPSKHYGWDCNRLLEQVRQILVKQPQIHWRLADSRRTPAECRAQLARLAGNGLEYVAHESCGADWLATTLPDTERVWVSEDSVSMVYEALTAQARVGLLDAPRIQDSRVSRGIDELVAQGALLRFADWQAGAELPQSGFGNEADRCAKEIEARWLRQS
jgi:mitochondrial fission protein ELM1